MGSLSTLIDLVYAHRTTFVTLNEAQSRRVMLEQLVHASYRPNSVHVAFKWHISGKEVCFEAYRRAKGWLRSRAYQLKRQVEHVVKSNPEAHAGVWNPSFGECAMRIFNTNKPPASHSVLNKDIKLFLFNDFTYLEQDPTCNRMYTDFPKKKTAYEAFIDAQKHTNDPM